MSLRYQDGFYATPKEISSLKPLISSFIQNATGSKQESIESVVIDCLDRKLELVDIKNVLDKYLSKDSSIKLLDLIIDDVNQSRQHKRKHGEENDNGRNGHGSRNGSNHKQDVDEEYKKRVKVDQLDDSSASRRRSSRERDDNSNNRRSSRERDDRDYRDYNRGGRYDDRDYRDYNRGEDRYYSRSSNYEDSRDNRAGRGDRDRDRDRDRHNDRDGRDGSSNGGRHRDDSSRNSSTSASSSSDSSRSTNITNSSPSTPTTSSPTTNSVQKVSTTSTISPPIIDTPPPPPTTSNPTMDKIQLLKARLEARKAELEKQPNSTTTTTITITNPSTISTPTPPPIISTPTTTPTSPLISTPTPPIISTPTPKSIVEPVETNTFFDPRLVPKEKKKKTIESFNLLTKPGKFTKKADKMRMEQLQQELAKKDVTTQSVAVKTNIITDDVPDMEWWDRDILEESCQSYDQFFEESETSMDASTNIIKNQSLLLENDQWFYVEHPIVIYPPPPNAPPPKLQIVPPLKERKKMRRMRREEALNEKLERIAAGYEKAPPNRVKMSTVMRVLTTQAVADPTKVIEQVRSQYEERLQAHLQRNEENKLTPEQRREKKEQKALVDASRELKCALYRVGDLSHPLNRAKVSKMAEKLCGSGCAIISAQMCLVIIEAGEKSLKQYSKLMTRRIDWANLPPITSDNSDPNGLYKEILNQRRQHFKLQQQQQQVKSSMQLDQVGEEDDKYVPTNSCVKIWEGPIQKNNFPTNSRFHFEICTSEAQARKYLTEHHVPHYWDMAKNFIDQ